MALLKSALAFFFTVVLLVLASFVSYAVGQTTVAQVLDEMAILLVGTLTIRVFGLTAFRVFLPSIGFMPPRILEDIILVLAYIAWSMVRMSQVGVHLSGLITTSAVITGILAFSMQDTLGNILCGLALQLDDSIGIGNWIKVDEVSGQVIEVHWRHTAIRTRNGEIVVIPNSVLMKAKVTIVGSKHVPQWRRWIHFQTPINVPPQRIIDTVNRTLAEAEIDLVSKAPLPSCVLLNYKDGLAHYGVRYWLTDPQIDDPTDSEVRAHIFATLQRHGYSLATPVMDITMTAQSQERETRLRDAELEKRQKTLRHMDLFSGLSEDECNLLARTLTVALFAKGDVITRQGSVAHWLYVLTSGEVDIWFEINAHERKHLATLSAGRAFGEMGLMTGEPRRATAIARTEVECYRIDKSSFEQIMQSRPTLAEEFARILSERNQKLAALKNEPQQSHSQQRAHILRAIKLFFRLN